MKRWAALTMWGVLCAACVPAQSVPVEPAVPGSGPAELQSYDILVRLVRLPRAYSCDQLWSKFRAVLLALGAARVDEVVPSECASASPSIHLQFELPRQLAGRETRYAQLHAQQRVVRLGPGEPPQLEAADCRLAQEISESLLTDLPVRVVDSRFDCARGEARAANGKRSGRFALRVQALVPQWPLQEATELSSRQG